MKIIIFLFATLCYVWALNEEEVNQKWSSFQEKYRKEYKSPIETRRRFLIFHENLKKIELHNALFQQGLVSHKNGVNQFADWTEKEFEAFVNKYQMSKKKINGTTFVSNPDFKKPQSVDWRTKGAVTEVKDQGMCGSCWAFSSTGSLEGQNFLTNGKLVSLSEQELMDCSVVYGNFGCQGGLMTNAFKYVKKNGIRTEDEIPYKAFASQCKNDDFKPAVKLEDYVTIKQGKEHELQEAIASKGPVSVAIHATSLLQLYEGGILKDPTCSSNPQFLNHGVLAVGYGVEDGVKYYIVKNSWGESWGEEGYVRLAKHKNMCGIANMASIPTVLKS